MKTSTLAATGSTILVVVGLASLFGKERTGISAVPSAGSVIVAPGPNSVLALEVSFVSPGAVQAQVISSSPLEKLTTPWLPVPSNGRGTIAVLGLAAGRTYTHTVWARDALGAVTALGSVEATTGALPADLSSLTLTMKPVRAAPEPGYLLVSGSGPYVVAFDEAGIIRWYRRFDPGTIEAKMQYDGTFTAFVGTSTGYQPVQGEYERFQGDGTVTATYTMPAEQGKPTLYCDPHDLQISRGPDGDLIHTVGYEVRGDGAKASPVAVWHCILRQDAAGKVDLRWNSWDYFTSSDMTDPVPRWQGPRDASPQGGVPGVADIEHVNSLEIAPDGNYVASFRDTDAVLEIDARTGRVIWQLGGARNQFTFRDDSLGGFSGQHSARPLPGGDILLYDNGVHHEPRQSRAVEYALDTKNMTATLVWEFRHDPPIYTPFVGSVERLANGNTLVAFALEGLVDEVDPRGKVLWEAQLLSNAYPVPASAYPAFCYRIRRLPSLYRFEQP